MPTNIDTGLTVQDAVAPDQSPHIFTMSNGDLVVLYYNGTNLVYRAKHSGTWGAATTITLDTGVSPPKISYWTRNGDTLFGGASTDPIDASHNGDWFRLVYSTSTQTFTQTKQIDNADGNVKVAGHGYTSGGSVDDQVLSLRGNAAGNFTVLQELNVDPTVVGVDQTPNILDLRGSTRTGVVTDGTTTTYLAYACATTGTAFKVDRFVAGTLGVTSETPPAPAANPVGISGIYDGTNYYFIINENNAKLRFLKRTGTNTWGSWTDILSDASLSGAPAVCVKANGDLAVFYRTNKNQANGEIWSVQRTGGTWGSPALLAGGASTGWSNPSCAPSDKNDAGVARLVYVTGTASTWTLVEDSLTFGAGGGGTSWNQSLTDAFSELDVRVSQVNKPFLDATSALDAFTKLYQAVKTDAISETDASTHSATKPFTEAVSETDTSTRTTGKNLGDATSATDHTGPFGVNKPLGDVTSALDLIAKLVAKAPFTEFISETDSVTRFRSLFQTILDAFSEKDALGPKTVQKALADATSALDALTKLVTTLRTDAFSLVDALSKIPAKALLDAFAETDSLNAFKPSGTAWNQTLTDKHSALDVVVRQITKVNSDAISALDTFARTWVAHLLFTEMFSETDATQKALLRTIQDTQVAQDIVQKLVQHTVVEAMSATDSQTRQTLRLVADAISALDSRTTSVRKVVFDTLSATDKVTAGKLLLLALLDAFSVLDSAGQPQLAHPLAAKKIAIAASIVATLLNIQVTLQLGTGIAIQVVILLDGLPTITAILA